MTPDSAVSHDMLVTSVAAVAAGTMLVVLARRAGLPTILVLLAGGFLLGPEVLDVVRPESLGGGLLVVVELAVGLILFEGGLTLDREGYRSAPSMIKRLLTAGVLVTWLGITLALRLVTGLPWSLAVVAASLVIVTGPTVIAPLLQRIRLIPKLHNVLYWEAVLIEPIGVFIAVLCFEWTIGGGVTGALANLGVRVGAGAALGVGGGLLISLAMSRRVVPRDMTNVFALAGAVLVFGVAEAVIPKAGLLAVTLAGFVVGATATDGLRQLRVFKAEITSLLIGTLFILLTARLSLDQFRDFGIAGAVVVVLVMVVVRPLSVMLCAMGLDLTGRERLFLAWIAPRGIVAASMASLFAISLEQRGVAGARFVEAFTYSVILATIIVQASTAGTLARLLDLRQRVPDGWLVVGAHALGQRFAQFLRQTAGRTVVLVDTNGRAVHAARAAGLAAIQADARDTGIVERHGLTNIGSMFALTDNEDLNARLCAIWTDVVGAAQVYRCALRGGVPGSLGGDTPGVAVWPSLPRPTLLAAELGRGEASLEEAAAGDLPDGAVPLAAFDGDSLTVDPRPESLPVEARVLYMRRRADYLLRSVRADLVLTGGAADFREVIEQLVDRMVLLQPDVPRDATIADLVGREASAPSLIGHGVAVPHTYVRGLARRLCGIARSAEGIRFPGPGGEPVRLVFLLVSPQGDPQGHLATLAEIARLASVEMTRERLIAAASPMEVIHVVRRRGG